MTASIDSDTVFNQLESDRKNGFTETKVTEAPFFFEARKKTSGLLDRVDSKTGERKTGKFENGKFREINA